MASNEIPKSYDLLIEHMEDAADGAGAFGPLVGLRQNTEPRIRFDLEALTGRPAGNGGTPPAIPGLKALVNAARANKTAKTAALRTVQSNGRALAMTCISTLKPVLGTTWNSQWNAAGFDGGSLSVPTNPMTQLQQLRAYYLANPGREVSSVNGIACTAAACEAAAQAISTAQSESNQSNTEVGIAQANFVAGVADGRRRMSGLRDELSQLLKSDDERWYAFGFDRPSDPVTPEVPENVTIQLGIAGAGSIFTNWDDARRATGYRGRILDAATNNELATELMQDTEWMVSGLPSGQEVIVLVTARNEAGESQATAPVKVMVP
jgi:hypothetical protein